MSLPQHVHQLWWTWHADGSFDDAARRVPFAAYARRWRRMHPRWQFTLWRRPQAYAYVEQHFPDDWPRFLAYPRHIQRCDFFRMLVLWREGGVYADRDTYPLRSLTILPQAHPHAACFFPLGRVLTDAERGLGPPQLVDNCWMWVTPGHPQVARLLDTMRERAATPVRTTWDVLRTTGPVLFAEVLQAPAADVVLLSEDQSQATVRHLYAQSWREERELPAPEAPRVDPHAGAVTQLVQRGVVPNPAALLPQSLAQATALIERLEADGSEPHLPKLLRAYMQSALPASERLELLQLWLQHRYRSDLGPLRPWQKRRLTQLQDANDALVLHPYGVQ